MDRSYDLQSWKLFLAVARKGSISGVCNDFGMDAAGASRVLSALEKSLGDVPLINRSVRPLALTDNGKIAFSYAEKMLSLGEEMGQSINHDPNSLKGIIRAALPPAVLRDLLTPQLMKFCEQYPDIDLQIEEYTAGVPISFENHRGDLLDIVVSYGPDRVHPNIVQICYGRGDLISCASPMYLKRFGTPQTPEDLSQHTGIVISNNMRATVQTLTKGKESCAIRWKKQIIFDSPTAAKTAVLLGSGIHTSLPLLHCFEEIQQKKLIPLFPDWEQPSLGLYIYTRPECVKLKRVRLFIDWYKTVMAKIHSECFNATEPYFGDRMRNNYFNSL
mgnify:CR=1 FL=1